MPKALVFPRWPREDGTGHEERRQGPARPARGLENAMVPVAWNLSGLAFSPNFHAS